MHPLLILAANVAVAPGPDRRNYRLGCVGIRGDGVIVSARNGAGVSASKHSNCLPCHAEVRCSSKMGRNGVVFVARILRDGSLANARPCRGCQVVMRSRGIKRAYYTITDTEYGVLDL